MATSRPSCRGTGLKPSTQALGSQEENRNTQDSLSMQTRHAASKSQSEKLNRLPENSKSQIREMQSCKSKADNSRRCKSSSQKELSCSGLLNSEGECPKLQVSSFINSIDRPSSCNRVKKAPLVNRVNSDLRRTPTPTKNILLEAAKRRQEPTTIIENPVQVNTSHKAKSVNQNGPSKDSKNGPESRSSPVVREIREDKGKKDGESEGEEEDGTEDEDSSSEDEVVKAPNELMMEFLDCVIKGDYTNGLKLCTMILLYEPENAEALNFKSLIEEKIVIDTSNQEESEGDSGGDDDDDDNDDDDEDEDDDSEEDDTDNSEDDSDESESSDRSSDNDNSNRKG